MRYSNGELDNWTSPLSETEEARVENTEKMIRDAIRSDPNLNKMDIEVFVQGSYANNTNVKAESDIDICVMLKDTFHSKYPEGKTREDYGFVASSMKFLDYKDMVRQAITKKFGAQYIKEGNKSFKINENTYHVKADVVPAFQYRNYKYIGSIDPDRFVNGIYFLASDMSEVINYPKVHIENGNNKNIKTNRRYKKAVRIMKKIKNNMVDDNITNGDVISSFLVECLVYNVPDSIFINNETWIDIIKEIIIFLYNSIKEKRYTNWGEVSEMYYLFHENRKWKPEDAMQWLFEAWNYLEY